MRRPPQAVDQRLQRRDRRSVRFAVDPLRPEVALKGRDHLPGLAIVDPRDLHAIAIERQHRLHRPHRRAFLLVGEQRRAEKRRGLGPMADAALAERLPRKRLARVALARRGDVGMREYALGSDRPARADVARELDRRLDLALRKRRRAAVMAGIDDLDPDRGGVQVAFALPRALPACQRPSLSATNWSIAPSSQIK